MEFFINFRFCPGKSHGVLAHFESGSCNAACVCSFAGHEINAVFHYIVCCFKGSRHICALYYIFAAVCNKSFCTVKVKLILCCTWKVNITFNVPDTFAFCISRTFHSFCVFFNTSSFYFFNIFYNIKLNAVRIINKSVGVIHGNDFGTKLLYFFYSVNSNVSGTCHNNSFSTDGIIMCFCDFVQHIDNAVTGSLCTDKRTAVSQTFAC